MPFVIKDRAFAAAFLLLLGLALAALLADPGLRPAGPGRVRWPGPPAGSR